MRPQPTLLTLAMLLTVVAAATFASESPGIVRMTSVAPTIAKFLGLDLSPQAGAPLPIDFGAPNEKVVR